ncbi:MAG: M28 family peptidase [Bacteroidales bacterium]|nr:M28 family peptidase [Bacteroidales bacterium]
MGNKLNILVIFALILSLSSCKKSTEENQTTQLPDYTKVEIPTFNADSAYSYVKAQCDFGPRIPMSKAAQLCGDYLIDFMKKYADTVYVQNFNSSLWDGTKVEGRNIIASFNPESSERVVLAAHWDSRTWADEDPNEENHKKAIDGANDGASGVGVLMEIARVFRQKQNTQGVDIIFFDLEDQGTPSWAESDVEDQSDWCLGSQYWSKTPHYPFYTANYGILLDMVGYKNLRFTKEGLSMHYAPYIMNKVWDIAAAKNYSNIFINEKTYPIMDDHHWVNLNARIPMIDIVQNDSNSSFFPFWHTMQDNMENISKESLRIVGEVCLITIFSNQ